MTAEGAKLRKLYWWAFTLRYCLGIGGWLLTQFAQIPFLQDALYYEEVGASIAQDWLSGRASTWLATVGRQPHQPVLLVTFIGCFYVLTMGVRAIPLLLATYCAITAFTPPLTYRIARQLGATPKAAMLAGWLVAVSPAFVFWCGALYKEGLVLLVVNLSVYHTLRLQARWEAKSFAVLLACLLGLSGLRLYLALIMAFVLGPGLLLARSQGSGRLPSPQALMVRPLVLGFFALAIAAAGLTARVRQVLPADFEEALYRIEISRTDLASTSSGYLPDANISTREAAVRFLPLGIMHFLTVPLPWQFGSLRQNLAIPDTAMWLALYPLILLGMVRALSRNFQGSLILAAATLAICLLYALLVGNIGTAYRLRTQVWLLWAPFAALGWEAFRRPRPRSHAIACQVRRAA